MSNVVDTELISEIIRFKIARHPSRDACELELIRSSRTRTRSQLSESPKTVGTDQAFSDLVSCATRDAILPSDRHP